MSSHIIIGTERLNVDTGTTIENAMISAGKHPDAFLFLLNGRPVPMTLVPEDGMYIEALRVASGG
jgi:sulfur carrier protein